MCMYMYMYITLCTYIICIYTSSSIFGRCACIFWNHSSSIVFGVLPDQRERS